MQECFWDENTETMQMCISGAYLSSRATTVSRSFQIVGNTTSKLVMKILLYVKEITMLIATQTQPELIC